ncbi:hypothetical protein [uncultured Flavonifractor sp.]|uniref:hypothetical protein n=1 Tax=uncultured Flavonifractor sp. TaxID=1193534 RepID=UPI0025995F6D|nr:hypothetical protein [uncultured Flavonifractor sp.]
MEKNFEKLAELCFDCGSECCSFAHDGQCRFPLVHERAPHITEDDGCLDCVFDIFKEY